MVADFAKARNPPDKLVVLGLPSDLLCLAESATNDAFCST
jgi:hypothetical protein